jgi:hypothetical protein
MITLNLEKTLCSCGTGVSKTVVRLVLLFEAWSVDF